MNEFNFSIYDCINETDDMVAKIKAIQESMVIEVLDESYRIDSQYLKANIDTYGDEGTIPHFHLKLKGTKYESCFCIFENKYANHESNHVKLEPNKLFALNVFLMSPNRSIEDRKVNYWQCIVQDWANKNAGKNWEHCNDFLSVRKPNYNLTIECRNMGHKYNHDKAKTI